MKTRGISYLPVPDRDTVPEGVTRLWDKAQEAFGFVPNVFRAQAVNGEQFLAWWGYFNLLVNKEGHLSNADRELLAVVVSSVNRCDYCAISHGPRCGPTPGRPHGRPRGGQLAPGRPPGAGAGDGRVCREATLHPAEVTEADLQPLRGAGLGDHEIVELVQVVGMFNLTNRVSTALGFVANEEYHTIGRP